MSPAESKTLKGVMLHGGHGTRLRPLTHTGPKQLIPIANKPISQYVLESLRDAGCKEIAIVLGDIFPEKVREFYDNGARFGVKIIYIPQGEPKGIAHAVGLTEDFVGNSPFVVHLGDDLLRDGVRGAAKEFLGKGYDSFVVLSEVKNPQRFGVAELDGRGELKRVVEKPKSPPSNLALTGAYFFTRPVFDAIRSLKPSGRGELEITEAIQVLLDRGYKVGHEVVNGWWKDTGTPEDILEVNRLILDELKPLVAGQIEEGVSLQGRVSIGEGAVVKTGAVVRGPSLIGPGSLVEGRVYIGPYTSLGENVRVVRGEIQNSIVMDNCIIDVDEGITDSILGPYSFVSGAGEFRPKGKRLIVGERSTVNL